MAVEAGSAPPTRAFLPPLPASVDDVGARPDAGRCRKRCARRKNPPLPVAEDVTASMVEEKGRRDREGKVCNWSGGVRSTHSEAG